MDKQTAENYKKIDKLSNVNMNNLLIGSLSKKLVTGKNKIELLKFKADLLRKSGQLNDACTIYRQLDSIRKSVDSLHVHSKILSFNSLQLDSGYSTAPLFIIDDFLTEKNSDEIFQHVLLNNNNFRKANIDSNSRYYAPNKRETMVLDDIKQFKPLFVSFLHKNLDLICKALGVPFFRVSRVEMKITNHIDGGFFKTHADNTTLFGETGRVISWLYYFHRQPKQFVGGDLFAFDTNVENQSFRNISFTKVETKHNRFVAFPSCYFHTVSPVNLSTNNFTDGRMAIAGHVHFKKGDVEHE